MNAASQGKVVGVALLNIGLSNGYKWRIAPQAESCRRRRLMKSIDDRPSHMEGHCTQNPCLGILSVMAMFRSYEFSCHAAPILLIGAPPSSATLSALQLSQRA